MPRNVSPLAILVFLFKDTLLDYLGSVFLSEMDCHAVLRNIVVSNESCFASISSVS